VVKPARVIPCTILMLPRPAAMMPEAISTMLFCLSKRSHISRKVQVSWQPIRTGGSPVTTQFTGGPPQWRNSFSQQVVRMIAKSVRRRAINIQPSVHPIGIGSTGAIPSITLATFLVPSATASRHGPHFLFFRKAVNFGWLATDLKLVSTLRAELA
jgi:hypothetical protein